MSSLMHVNPYDINKKLEREGNNMCSYYVMNAVLCFFISCMELFYNTRTLI